MLFPQSPPPSYWNEFVFQEGWARTADSLDVGKEAKQIANLSSVIIPPEHPLYLSLKKYILNSLANKKMSAPKGEDARMGHAQSRLAAAEKKLTEIEGEIQQIEKGLVSQDLKSSKEKEKEKQQKIIDAAKRRLQEKKGKVKPPGSRLITIRNIRLLKQTDSWYRYSAMRDLMLEKAAPNGNQGLYPFKWCVPPAPSGNNEIDRAPLLNPPIGETLLFHGTGRYPLQQYIIPMGFDPLFAQKHAGGYGMLGQGTYFTDSFALAMCYCACKTCGDFECNCRSTRGRKTSRNVLLARVLLGTPRMYPTFTQKYVGDRFRKKGNERARQVRALDAFQEGKTLSEDTYRAFLEEQFQSIFAQGLYGVSTLLSAGSTCNQFNIRHNAQAYLEFVVDYVICPDSSLYSEALRAKLQEYNKQTSGLRGVFTHQSIDSQVAHALLTDLVNIHDGIKEHPQPVSEDLLKGAVRYFLGKGPDVLQLQEEGFTLNLKGRLAGLLRTLPG